MKKIIISLTIITSSLTIATNAMMQVVPTQMLIKQPTYNISVVPLTFNTTQETLVDQRLKAIAEIKGLGYKTANLGELASLMQNKELQTDLKKFGYSVNVPEFVGIASPEIVKYLESNDFNLTYEWEKIREYLPEEIQKQALETKELPTAFEQATEVLGTKLESFFNNQATKIEQCGFIKTCWNKYIGKDCFLTNNTFQSFIQRASKTGQKLIVRSTGMEDKKGLANAGGNESIKRVQPKASNILRAIGQVLKSYFSPKSLKQRLGSGDTSIFNLPTIPMLLQVFVEKQTGQRPIECVIHTTEDPTPKLTSLNCGYGIVESTQRGDICYHFHTGEGHCILAKNVEHLPEAARQSLVILAAKIEEHYQRPTDIELLVHTSDKTISIVQARPINLPEWLTQPSYIKYYTHIPTEQIIPATTIVPAGSSTHQITTLNQIITATTLAEALSIYLNRTPNKTLVSAIVVQSNAEQNSHEATTFASEGKLVMVASDYEKFNEWLKTNPLNLYLDPQQNIIIKTETNQLTIANGYTRSPIQGQVSIEKPITKKNLNFAIKDTMPDINTKTLISTIKRGNQDAAIQALGSLLMRINTQITEQRSHIACIGSAIDCPLQTIAQDALTKFEALGQFATQKALAAIPYLTLPENNLQRLAVIAPLEALAFQREDQELVDIYSVASVMKQFAQRKNFIEQQVLPEIHNSKKAQAILSNIEFLDAAQSGHTVAITPELEKKWLMFMIEVAQAPKEQQTQFGKILQTLTQFNLVSLWINTLFNTVTGDFTTMLTQLYTDIVNAQQQLIALGLLQKELGTLSPAQFGSPEKFQTNKAILLDIINYFIDPNFIENLASDNKITIAATVSTMNACIDLVDRSIKAFKTSAINQKVEHFKELLHISLKSLQAWAPLAKSNINFHNDWPLDKYLEQLKTILETLSDNETELLPSKDFSVSAAMLGSNTAFERHYPQTAEDVFTLIHQNSLVIVGSLMNRHLAPLMAKPEVFEQLETALLKQQNMRLISLSFSEDGINAHYNLPLRNHAAVFDIVYNKKMNTTQLIIRFIGERRTRWDSIEAQAFTNYLQHSSQLPKTELGNQEVSITYNFNTQNNNTAQLPENIEKFVDLANELQFTLPTEISDIKSIYKLLQEKSSDNSIIYRLLGQLIQFNDQEAIYQAIDIIRRNYPNDKDYLSSRAISIARQNIFDKEIALYLALIRIKNQDIIPLALSFLDENPMLYLYLDSSLSILLALVDQKNPTAQTYALKTATDESIESLYRLQIFKALVYSNYQEAYEPAYDTAKNYTLSKYMEIKYYSDSILNKLTQEKWHKPRKRCC